MICVVRIHGIRLVVDAEQAEVLFHGDRGEVERYFLGTGTHIDLDSTDLPQTGWDYVCQMADDDPVLILDLDFRFERIGHSPFVFFTGDRTADIGEFCGQVRQMIRSRRIESIMG